MDTLFILVSQFRTAIEEAVEAGDLTIYPFRRFPNDCCDMTCDLLAQYLKEHNIDTIQINGVCKWDSQWHHVWLRTTDGTVIDITADQFAGKQGMPNYIDSVYVGDEGDIQKIFCNERAVEENTEFIGVDLADTLGVPNKRKNDLFSAYEIICEYL